MKTNSNLPGAKQLLQKYLDHQCTPEEEQQVLRWYFSFNREDDLLSTEKEQDKILQLVKQNVLSATTGEGPKSSAYQTGKVKSARLNLNMLQSGWLKVAAILVILCSAVYFGSNLYHEKEPALSAFSTLAAQRKLITLTDGTRVWLNNATVLRYPAKFGSRSREVELDGEAFFEVAHNPARPFLIHTQKLRVQVLGTSFNVRSYASDKDIAVNVATGKVAVCSSQKTVMLERGEGIVYNKQQQNFSASEDDTALSRAWQNNTLYFRYQTLETIGLRLERWYGVKFSITGEKLRQKKYTLEQHNETLENVMKVLSAGEFNYKITGRSVQVW